MASGGVRRKSSLANAVLASGIVGKEYIEGQLHSERSAPLPEASERRLPPRHGSRRRSTGSSDPPPAPASTSEGHAGLQVRCAELAGALASVQATAEGHLAKLAAAQAEIARLQQEQEAAVTQAVETTKREDDYALGSAEAARRLAVERALKLERELQKTREALEESRQREEKKKGDLQADRKQREEAVELLKRKHAEALQKLKQEASTELVRLQAERDVAMQDRDAAHDRITHLQRAVRERDGAISAVERELEECKVANEVLQQRLSAAASQTSSMRAKDAELARAREERDQASNRAEDLAFRLAEAEQSGSEERSRHAERLQQLADQVTHCEKEQACSLDVLRRTVERVSKRLGQALAARPGPPGVEDSTPPSSRRSSLTPNSSTSKLLVEMNDSLAAENAALLVKLAQKEAQLSQGEGGRKSENCVLRRDAEGEEMGSEAVEEQVLQRASATTLQAQLAAVKGELAAEVEERKALSAENESLQQRVQKLSKEVGRLRKEDASEQSKLQKQLQEMQRSWHSEEEWAAETAKAMEMATSLKNVREELIKRSQLVAVMKRDRDEQEAKHRGLLASTARLENDHKKVREEVLRKDAQIRNLRAQLESAHEVRASAEKSAATAALKVAALSEQLKGQQSGSTLSYQTLSATPVSTTEAGVQTDRKPAKEKRPWNISLGKPVANDEQEEVQPLKSSGENIVNADGKEAAAVLSKEVEKAKERVATLKKQVKGLKAEAESRAAQSRSQEEELARASAEVSLLQERLSAGEVRAAQLERACSDAQAAARASTADMMEVLTDRDRLDAACWRAKEALDERLREMEALKAAVKAGEKSAAVAIEAQGALRQQLSAIEKELEVATAEKDSLAAKVQHIGRSRPKCSITRAFSISCPEGEAIPPRTSTGGRDPKRVSTSST